MFSIVTLPGSLVVCFSLALFAGGQNAKAQGYAGTIQARQTPVGSLISSPSDAKSADQTYRLGPGDVLDVRVFNRPQLSRDNVRIDGRGMIRMPLIDTEIQAACRTESELASEIATRYLKYQRNPHVDVFIKTYQSQPVAVIGAVNLPGRFQLQRPMRLLELLTLAGGPSEQAGTHLQIAHSINAPICEEQTTAAATEDIATDAIVFYSLNETLQGAGPSNPFVRSGDIINVPDADLAFVVGNVLRPMSIELKDPLTVSGAIARAGGVMPDTKMDKVRVIRHVTGSGKKIEILVDIRAIEKQQAEDIPLQADDIVNVPASGGRRLLRSLVSSVFPAAGQLPVQVIAGQVPTAGTRRPR
jgi:polysaccharide export outer membrane protein